jgi:hypothetical protein
VDSRIDRYKNSPKYSELATTLKIFALQNWALLPTALTPPTITSSQLTPSVVGHPFTNEQIKMSGIGENILCGLAV